MTAVKLPDLLQPSLELQGVGQPAGVPFVARVQFGGAAERRFGFQPVSGAEQYSAQRAPDGGGVRRQAGKTPVEADGFPVAARRFA